jgi:twitching motility protein PilI
MKRSGIDWEQVRHRLLAIERSVEEALADSPARIEAAYRRRAIRLAKRQVELEPVSAGLPSLVFGVARERFAIELKELSEVLPFVSATPAPGAPPWLCGVINLRGEIRAVVDLRRLLTPSEDAEGEAGFVDPGFVLMLCRPGSEIGLRVDRIEGLRAIRPDELGPAIQGNYVRAIASGALMLLNVEVVLAQILSKEESLTI